MYMHETHSQNVSSFTYQTKKMYLVSISPIIIQVSHDNKWVKGIIETSATLVSFYQDDIYTYYKRIDDLHENHLLQREHTVDVCPKAIYLIYPSTLLLTGLPKIPCHQAQSLLINWHLILSIERIKWPSTENGRVLNI